MRGDKWPSGRKAKRVQAKDVGISRMAKEHIQAYTGGRND